MGLVLLFQHQQQVRLFHQVKPGIPGLPVEDHRVLYPGDPCVDGLKAFTAPKNVVLDALIRDKDVDLQPPKKQFLSQPAKPQQNDLKLMLFPAGNLIQPALLPEKPGGIGLRAEKF